jgi:hypothetical protein
MGSDQLGRNNVPLNLNEFRILYRGISNRLPEWAAFLLIGLLVWIEGKTIQARIKNEVDEAISQYKTLHSPPTVSVPPPVYSETGSDFFDEMRLTAPWVDREPPSDSP